MNEQKEIKPTTGWFAVRWMLPLFGAMIIANSFFVWFALSTHSGNQTKNAYDEGVNYNQVLEQARERALLGWQVGVEVKQNLILISLFDKEGNLLDGADVDLLLFNPRSADDDQELTVEKTALGQYSALYPTHVQGYWQLRFKINKDGKQVEFRRKMVLP
jgi:nitrogen fixation protein FixH